MKLYSFIHIDENSRVPKYQQIVNSVIENISNGNFSIDQKIPSINKFSEEFYLSRDTVEKAYSILKERNIITSIRGKGFYISRTKLISKVNILILFNKLSNYKLKAYNFFVDKIGANSHTDLQIYHCDETLFCSILEKNKKAYDYFVIMPHFKNEIGEHISFTDKAIDTLREIEKDKLVILDNTKPELSDALGVIYQDFENDIYNALEEGIQKIKNYNKIILVYPKNTVYPFPKRILHGFKKFCFNYRLDYEVIEEIYDDIVLKKGDLFITVSESDLVNLTKEIRKNNFKLGSNIGVISYNDTPLKELLGITVISTDFKVMGESAAETILNRKKQQLKVPFHLIERDSL